MHYEEKSTPSVGTLIDPETGDVWLVLALVGWSHP